MSNTGGTDVLPVLGHREGWRPIADAPKVHPMNGGDGLLLGWDVPGIGEWIIVVGYWHGEWHTGTHKAFPTHWMPLPDPPSSQRSET